jgi:hypothetical protein
MKPFNFDDTSSQNAQSCCCVRKDYPGRVQVKEGNYTGGGAQSAFIGRSDGNLGMALEAWPVDNTHPLGFMGWRKF